MITTQRSMEVTEVSMIVVDHEEEAIEMEDVLIGAVDLHHVDQWGMNWEKYILNDYFFLVIAKPRADMFLFLVSV